MRSRSCSALSQACSPASSASAAASCSCPTLTWLGLTQLHAEATSLLAIIPTVLVGVWRQSRYGNVRWRPALVIGVASIGATVGGAQVAESLPEHVLRKLFAVLLILTAAQIAWRARGKQP